MVIERGIFPYKKYINSAEVGIATVRLIGATWKALQTIVKHKFSNSL
jgi:hypothetical protein